MSRVYATVCLDNVTDLDDSPSVHRPLRPDSSDPHVSVHVHMCHCGLTLWTHDASKLRALAATLTRAAETLDEANRVGAAVRIANAEGVA